jgi:hypothetical protein
MAVVALCIAAAAQDAPVRLSIVVTEGEGAINNIKQRTSRETIVQVQDENHRPIAGAAVIFILPGDGAGGTFAGGTTTAATQTLANGQAVMPRLTPNQLAGKFQIRVTASYRGQQVSTAINQVNEAGGGGGASNTAHAGISGKTIGIIVAIAAAGAVGAAVGLRGGGNSNSQSTISSGQTSPNGTISLGTGLTIGPPH